MLDNDVLELREIAQSKIKLDEKQVAKKLTSFLSRGFTDREPQPSIELLTPRSDLHKESSYQK